MTFRIHLFPDDCHLPHVGRLKVGAQFWIDVQLLQEGGDTRDFVATYVFDLEGRLIWNEILDAGLRSEGNMKTIEEVILSQLKKLGEFDRREIQVHPFSVEAFGSVFGLVVREPEPDSDLSGSGVLGPLVDVMPGWTLMFYPPWEEGSYAS